jgi:hypothetical protein
VPSLTGGGLQRSPKIGEPANLLLQRPVDQLNGPRVPAESGHLREQARYSGACECDLRQIDDTFAIGFQHLARAGEVRWNPQFIREHIHRPQRQYAESYPRKRIRHIADSVQDFVHCPVAAGRDDQFVSFAHSVGSQWSRTSRSCRRLQRRARPQVVQVLPKTPRLIALSRWIENDAGLQRASLGDQ